MALTGTARDGWARYACRELGGQLNTYVTGDPGADEVAEYLAAGWLIADDYYTEDDDPPRDVAGQLIRALRQMGDALHRLAKDVDQGATPLDALRRIDLPATRPPA